MSQPYVFYGADLSYFTGKLEGYFRAKGLKYQRLNVGSKDMREAAQATGVSQMPQVKLADGTWLTDTTPIIAWCEDQFPTPALTPTDPLTKFISLLIEDYGDEWLWLPAMYYRWMFSDDRKLLSTRIAREILYDTPLPFWLKKQFIMRRQRRGYVLTDGADANAREQIETLYVDSLAILESVFRTRPFVLGQRPTEADFGFYGSMFRHFYCDPTGSRLMRDTAPSVTEWVARLWNLTPDKYEKAPMPSGVPEGLEVLFNAMASNYLLYLQANDDACAAGAKRTSFLINGVSSTMKTKPYRAWCLDELRRHFQTLNAENQATVGNLLGDTAAILRAQRRAGINSPIPPLPIQAQKNAKPTSSYWS